MILRRPLKFVVVGEVASGKTTLIKQFTFGDSKVKLVNGGDYSPTSVCDGSTLALMANVAQVQSDESYKSLNGDDIEVRLREKKFKPPSRDLDSDDGWAWNKISVNVKGVEPKWPPVGETSRERNIVKSTPALTSHCENEGGQWARVTTRPHSMVESATARQEVASKSHEQPEMSRLAVPKMAPRKPPRKEGVAKLNSAKNNEDLVEIEVDMWDTGGDKRCMWYRWYACTGADAVLMCVPLSSIMDFGAEQSWECVNTKENPNGPATKVSRNLRKFMSDELLSERTRCKKVNFRIPPVLLVGTKSDVYFAGQGYSPNVSTVEAIGLRLAREIGCCDFACCSVSNASAIAKVFETAVALSLTSVGKYRASRNVNPSISSESEAESTLSREVEQPTYFKMHSASPRQEALEEGKENDSDERVARRSQPPKIFFPPPPDCTPPSTEPPSSSSSRSASHGSSSLESLVDSLSDYQASTLALCGSSNPSSVNLEEGQMSDAKSSDDDIAMLNRREVEGAEDVSASCENLVRPTTEEYAIVHTDHSVAESNVCMDTAAVNDDGVEPPGELVSTMQERPEKVSSNQDADAVMNPIGDAPASLSCTLVSLETSPARLEIRNLSSQPSPVHKRQRPSPQKRRDSIFLRFLKS